MTDSKDVVFNGLQTNLNPRKTQHKDGLVKIGRNEKCYCGSGSKYKKCHGRIALSTGIKSDNSKFTVGKARIFADVAVDLNNKSDGHIEDLLHIAPDTPTALAEILVKLGVSPPKEFLDEALGQLRAAGTVKALENSRLKAWCIEQGLNVAFFAEFATSLLAIALQ